MRWPNGTMITIEGCDYEIFEPNYSGKGEGSGPATCYGGREADGSGHCDRRGERRVAPGEAEALVQAIENKAARSRKEHNIRKKLGYKLGAADAYGMAAAYAIAAQMVRECFKLEEPQPDSDASDNERSGRRNTQDQP